MLVRNSCQVIPKSPEKVSKCQRPIRGATILPRLPTCTCRVVFGTANRSSVHSWVKDSLTPFATASAARREQYGFKWWLFPYSKDDPRLAFGGQGFGGQKSIVIPAYDLVIVFTGSNMLGEKITRVSAAVKDR